MASILGQVFVPGFAFAAIGWFVPNLLFGDGKEIFTFLGKQSNDAFLFACVPVAYFYSTLWRRAQGEDKERLGALLPLCAAVIAFWAIFHQNGDALTTWAEEHPSAMPAAMASGASQVGLAQEVYAEHRVPVPDAGGEKVKGPDGVVLTKLEPEPYFNNAPEDRIGVWCYDSEPDKIIAKELKRDFDHSLDDNFEIIIDTYNDKRNGFLFVTNPNGAREDVQVLNNGRSYNSYYNAVWNVEDRNKRYGLVCRIRNPVLCIEIQVRCRQAGLGNKF